ncbi:MAG: S8 family serine peptidase [Methanobacteriota archaeon]
MISGIQTGELIRSYADIRVPGLLIVGFYRTFRRYSLSYIVLFTCLTTCCLVQWGASDEIHIGGIDRVILYTDPVAHVSGDLFFNNLSISSNCTLALQAPDLGFFVVEMPSNESKYYKNEISKLPWVTSVESDCIRMPEIFSNASPDDPSYPDQWAFNRTHVPEAWDILSPLLPEKNMTVAIIDTGVDAGHEDLTGVVSDKGVDWIENRSVMIDSDGHGTFMAGIVGAITSNGKGVSGVARVSILPERVGKNETGIFSSLSAVAIKHAADNGSRIILMGYGGPGQSPAEEAAITYAVSKGCILIAPAGNGASNEGHYPSDYSEVISVGSTAKTDGLSYFSNYGIFVELVAPGEGIISTWSGNTYQTVTGTSPAAALVAGTAALILEADPSLDRNQVREILSSTSRDLGRTGRDIYYGYGLIDTAAAVTSAVKGRKTVKNQNTALINLSEQSGNRTGIGNSFQGESSSMQGVKRSGLVNREIAEIPLNAGWNFISLPSIPGSGKTSGSIFQGINTDGHTIWKFNASTQDWTAVEKGTGFNPLEGFLIYSDRVLTIPLVLNDRNETPEMNMSPGWNLVGSPYQTPVPASEALSSLSSEWVSLLLYNTTTQSYDPAIIQGASGLHSDRQILPAFSAYWVYMNKEGLYRFPH